MMFGGEINVNAVLLAAVANIAIGMAWYSQKLFGKRWLKLSKITAKAAKNMQHAMVGSVVISLILAYSLAHFMLSMNVFSLRGACHFAFTVWLAFVATTQLSGVLWSKKPMELFWINSGYWFVCFMAMCAVLVSWK